MSKLVFLDIDGVLNNKSDSSGYFDFNPDTYGLSDKNLFVLDNLLTRIGEDVHVVISSDWRKYSVEHVYYHNGKGYRSQLGKLLKEFPEFDVCPHVDGASKLEDISIYLQKNPHENYVVIDDDRRLCAFGEHFFRIDSENGLTDADVEKIVSYLR